MGGKRAGFSATAMINRKDFDHWGPMPDTASPEYKTWMGGVRSFGKAIWEAVGERKNPKIVFEHPGEATLPTSGFVCETGGMVVIFAENPRSFAASTGAVAGTSCSRMMSHSASASVMT